MIQLKNKMLYYNVTKTHISFSCIYLTVKKFHTRVRFLKIKLTLVLCADELVYVPIPEIICRVLQVSSLIKVEFLSVTSLCEHHQLNNNFTETQRTDLYNVCSFKTRKNLWPKFFTNCLINNNWLNLLFWVWLMLLYSVLGYLIQLLLKKLMIYQNHFYHCILFSIKVEELSLH